MHFRLKLMLFVRKTIAADKNLPNISKLSIVAFSLAFQLCSNSIAFLLLLFLMQTCICSTEQL